MNTGGTVWLAEQSSGYPSEILGVFSKPERARQACQDIADGYFGPAHTPPLTWLGNDGHSSASWHHPAAGIYLFQITQFKVDQAAAP
jgi:hypothetical protein